MSWLTRRSYLESVIKQPMDAAELRAEFCKLPLVGAPSPELLLYHAVLAIDRLEHVLRDIERMRAPDAWILASESIRKEFDK